MKINKKYSNRYLYVDDYGCFLKARYMYFIMYPFWMILVFLAKRRKKIPHNYKLCNFYMRMLHIHIQRM